MGAGAGIAGAGASLAGVAGGAEGAAFAGAAGLSSEYPPKEMVVAPPGGACTRVEDRLRFISVLIRVLIFKSHE